MASEKFKEEFRQETGYEWRPWRWTSKGFGVLVLLMVVGGLVSAVIWVIGVATSDVQGRGEAVKIKNDAINRTQAQAQFQGDFNSVRSLDQRLNDAQKTLDVFNAAHPNVGNGTVYDPLAEQQANLMRTVTGLQQQCRTVVAHYSANSRTYTLRDFRDADLPKDITENDPYFTDGVDSYEDFDCEVG